MENFTISEQKFIDDIIEHVRNNKLFDLKQYSDYDQETFTNILCKLLSEGDFITLQCVVESCSNFPRPNEIIFLLYSKIYENTRILSDINKMMDNVTEELKQQIGNRRFFIHNKSKIFVLRTHFYKDLNNIMQKITLPNLENNIREKIRRIENFSTINNNLKCISINMIRKD